MEQVVDELETRTDVLSVMRGLANQGATVRQLVDCARRMLNLDQDALLPILWYFMKAFHVPLGDVLPIREWLRTENDEDIDRVLLPAILSTRDEWTS